MTDTTGKAVPTRSADVDAQNAKNRRDADRDKAERDRKTRIRNQVSAIRASIIEHGKATTTANRAVKALNEDAGGVDLVALNEELAAASARRKEAEAKLALARRVAKIQA